MDLTPTIPLGGDNNGGWGDAVGAFAGALFGSWFGNGWGGGAYGGGRGGNGGGCCGGGAPSVVIAGNPGGGSTAELDALSGISSAVGTLGLQSLQGQNTTNMAMCQGFSGVVAADNANTASLMNATTQGFAGLNTAIMSGDMGIQQSLCQGFNGLNTAVLVGSKDAALQSCQSTNAITSAIDNCCCNTRATIMAEGSATRQLIDHYAYENLQTKVCDLKAENAALKSTAATSAMLQGAVAQLSARIESLRPTTTATA